MAVLQLSFIYKNKCRLDCSTVCLSPYHKEIRKAVVFFFHFSYFILKGENTIKYSNTKLQKHCYTDNILRLLKQNYLISQNSSAEEKLRFLCIKETGFSFWNYGSAGCLKIKHFKQKFTACTYRKLQLHWEHQASYTWGINFFEIFLFNYFSIFQF